MINLFSLIMTHVHDGGETRGTEERTGSISRLSLKVTRMDRMKNEYIVRCFVGKAREARLRWSRHGGTVEECRGQNCQVGGPRLDVRM